MTVRQQLQEIAEVKQRVAVTAETSSDSSTALEAAVAALEARIDDLEARVLALESAP